MKSKWQRLKQWRSWRREFRWWRHDHENSEEEPGRWHFYRNSHQYDKDDDPRRKREGEKGSSPDGNGSQNT